MASWYYVDERRAAGPVDDDGLRHLARVGRLGAASLVTPVGATAWSTLGHYEAELGLDRRLDGSYRADRPPALRPAPLGRRGAAALVDGVLFGLPALTFALLTDGLAVSDEAGRAAIRFEGWGLALTGLLALAYFGLLVGITGQTPGKLALGLVVVDERLGGPVGAARGVARAAATLAMAALCLLPLLVDVLWPLGDLRRRAIHDRLVGSWEVDAQRSSGRRATQPNSGSGSPAS